MKSINIFQLNDLDPSNLVRSRELLLKEGVKLQIDTINWAKEYPYCPEIYVYIAYTEEGLFLNYEVKSQEGLRITAEKDGEYVYMDSCMEFFHQKEVGEQYINYEFNVGGVCYASKHQTPTESTALSEAEFKSILRLAKYQGKTAVPNDEEWFVTAFIPWTTMDYPQGFVPQSFRANFYKCGDKTKQPHFVSWTEIPEPQPIFHRPQYFGEVILK